MLFRALMFMLLLFCSVEVYAESIVNITKVVNVIKVIPSGQMNDLVKQIVIYFDDNVAPLGDDRVISPVSITPDVQCSWVWLDAKVLACNLEHGLASATQYTFFTKKGTIIGDRVIGTDFTASLVTEVPKVDGAWFIHWNSPVLPIQQVNFNLPVSGGSVERSMQYVSGGKTFKLVATAFEKPEEIVTVNNEMFAKRWLVTPQEQLPAGATVELWVKAGLTSMEGTLKGQEDKVVTNFSTFPEFRFLGVKCSDFSGKRIKILRDSDAKCDPHGSFSVVFSAPVLKYSALKRINIANDKKSWIFLNDADGQYFSVPSMDYFNKNDSEYELFLGRTFDADAHYKVSMVGRGVYNSIKDKLQNIFSSQVVDSEITDVFGRQLVGGISWDFYTDYLKPSVRILDKVAVLEKNGDVMVQASSVDKFKFEYSSISSGQNISTGLSKEYAVPSTASKQSVFVPLGIGQLLNGKFGALYGKVSSDKVARSEDNGHAFATVTPYQVYAKLGMNSSLGWIVDLASGKGVANATVVVHKGSLSKGMVPLTKDLMTDGNGLVIFPGLDVLDSSGYLRSVWNTDEDSLIVTVKKGEEYAILPVGWESFHVDTYRMLGESAYIYNNDYRFWGIAAQGLYHPGDSVDYVVYLRKNNDKDRAVVDADTHYTMDIIGQSGKIISKIDDFRFSEYGSYSGKLVLQKDAFVGWYNAVIREVSNKSHEMSVPLFLVSDFNNAEFKVETRIKGKEFYPNQDLNFDVRAELYNGTAYSGGNVRLSVILEPSIFVPANEKLSGFVFGTSPVDHSAILVLDKKDKLDDSGKLSAVAHLQNYGVLYGQIKLETVVQDSAGRNIAGSGVAKYFGAEQLVGLRLVDDVLHVGEQSKIEYVVLDANESLIATDVNILIERKEVKLVRKKDAAGNYDTSFVEDWVKEANFSGTAGREVRSLNFMVKKAGEYRISASTKANDECKTQMKAWTVGTDYVSWDNAGTGNFIEIIPDKSVYHVGDVAKYLIKNPFPGAEALITVEKYNVHESFVRKLNDSASLIELPIRDDYFGGYYFSVAVLSPRVEGSASALSASDFRIGYVKSKVEDERRHLNVVISLDKESYKPRDKVKVKIHVDGVNGEPVQLAVSVPDAAILDYFSGSFDAYSGIYGENNLGVASVSLLKNMKLSSGLLNTRKGEVSGSDGVTNKLLLRNDFQDNNYWNANLVTDHSGNAEVEFTVADNLTTRAVIVVAADKGGRFGSQQRRFIVKQDTEIVSMLPSQITAGDNPDLGFVLVDASGQQRDLQLSLTVSGQIIDNGKYEFSDRVQLSPYERKVVVFPLKTKDSFIDGRLGITVSVDDKIGHDAAVYGMQFITRHPRVQNAYYGHGDGKQASLMELIKFSDDVVPGHSTVSVNVSPSIVSGIIGKLVDSNEPDYYGMLLKLNSGINKVVGAIAGITKENVNVRKAKIDEVLMYIANVQNYDGGIANTINGSSDPYISAYTAFVLQFFANNGYYIHGAVVSDLQQYLRRILQSDLTTYGDQMFDLKAFIASVITELDVNEIDALLGNVQQMSIFGKAKLIELLSRFPKYAERIDTLWKELRNNAIEDAGALLLNENNGVSGVKTPLKGNCTVLKALMVSGDAYKPYITKLVGGIGKLVMGKSAVVESSDFCADAMVHYLIDGGGLRPSLLVSADFSGTKLIDNVVFKELNDTPITGKYVVQSKDIGQTGKLNINVKGNGVLYYSVILDYLSNAVNVAKNDAGFSIFRTYSILKGDKFVAMKDADVIRRGDIIRVDLFVSTPVRRSFVVIMDDLPRSFEPIRDLLVTAPSFAYTHDTLAYRELFAVKDVKANRVFFYQDVVEAGSYHIAYYANVISTGEFFAQAPYVRERYSVDVSGHGSSEIVVIK